MALLEVQWPGNKEMHLGPAKTEERALHQHISWQRKPDHKKFEFMKYPKQSS